MEQLARWVLEAKGNKSYRELEELSGISRATLERIANQKLQAIDLTTLS
jgi:DNA-binding Xre family transcriptional regulator